MPKVDSAEQTITRAEPGRRGRQVPACGSAPTTSWRSCPGYDIVVDGLDNFPTRYLLNDASVRLQIPVVSAAILGFEGQLSVFKPYDGPVLPLPVPGAAAGRAGAVVRRQRRARRAAGDDGPAAGDRGHQADPRRGRPADRPAADVRRARRDASPRSRSAATPSARSARASPTRSPTRRWACSPTTRRSAPARRLGFAQHGHDQDSHRCCAPSVGGEKEVERRRRDRRRDPARGRRGAPGDRSRSCSPPTASSTATSTSTSTTRTCACSTGSRPRSATSDTLVILPAMAGGALAHTRLVSRPAVADASLSLREAMAAESLAEQALRGTLRRHRPGDRPHAAGRAQAPQPQAGRAHLGQARVAQPDRLGQGPRRARADRGRRGARG